MLEQDGGGRSGTIRGLLSDVHGVLYTHPSAVPGSVEAVARLRASNLPFLFVTNSTQFPKRHMLETLTGVGFELEESHLQTAVDAAGTLLRERGHARIGWMCSPDLAEDLPEFEPVSPEGSAARVDAVLVGDMREGFTFDVLNRAFRWILEGAELVALARTRYYQGPGGLTLDSGPFVKLLEEAAGVEATVTGKPSPAFFEAGLARLGVAAAAAVMIGDDLDFDVHPAMDLGLAGWQVRTGKYREERYREAGRKADRVVDDFAAGVRLLLE